MSLLLIDCETYSDLDVTKVGSRPYALHPTTEVILWSVRDPEWEDSLVFEQADLWQVLRELKAANLIEWTRNEELTLVHWGPFDRHIVQYDGSEETREHVWDPADDRFGYPGPGNTFWVDLSTASLTLGGPAKLKWAAAFFAGAETKYEGSNLIKRFCAPKDDGTRRMPSEDPVRWERFRAYARQDTNVMVDILTRMDSVASEDGWDLDEHASGYAMIERMNNLGVGVDERSASIANALLFELEDNTKVSVKQKYGVNVSAPKAVAEFVGTDNAQKDTLEAWLKSDAANNPMRREVAEARLLVSGAATKKLVRILDRCIGERVHDCFVYHGAWTRRLTSVGVQLQNFVREPSDEKFFELLGTEEYEGNLFRDVRDNIRGFLCALNGNVLQAADYSAIECRYSAWLAGETWLIEAFERGEDPYLIMASAIFGKDVTDKEDPRRQFGKVVELGSQYQLGSIGLMNQCAQRGIEITEDFARRTISTYRELHPNIVRTWGEMQLAYQQTARSDYELRYDFRHGMRMERTKRAIRVVRPSGFAQYYWTPSYDGRSSKYIGRYSSGQMGWKDTYGGDLFQGAVQGGAADLMLHAVEHVAREEMLVPVLSIHDELVYEVDQPFLLDDLLCDLPAWAKGLPVAAEGWVKPRFTK